MQYFNHVTTCEPFDVSNNYETAQATSVTSLGEDTLNEAEALELSSLEASVERALKAFWEIGQALRKILDKGLYRENYKTFSEYCINRWEMSRRTAYYLIEAASVYENVNRGSQILPANERQARPLTSLTPEEQQKVWAEVISTAPSGKITATHVTKVVKEYRQLSGKGTHKSKQTSKNQSQKPQKAPENTNKPNESETNQRSCWNCIHCSSESLDDPHTFYCYQLGKLNFIEKDGNTRGNECEFWAFRLAQSELKEKRVLARESFTLSLYIPVHLRVPMQDIAKTAGLNLIDWATQVLYKAVLMNNPDYKLTVDIEVPETFQEVTEATLQKFTVGRNVV